MAPGEQQGCERYFLTPCFATPKHKPQNIYTSDPPYSSDTFFLFLDGVQFASLCYTETGYKFDLFVGKQTMVDP
jgi:hypothetical protein